MSNNIEEDSIDIVAYIKKIWNQRILIIKTLILFFFIGCLVALWSPVVYISQTTFVPQISGDEISTNNRLGSLASLAGININPMTVPVNPSLSKISTAK